MMHRGFYRFPCRRSQETQRDQSFAESNPFKTQKKPSIGINTDMHILHMYIVHISQVVKQPFLFGKPSYHTTSWPLTQSRSRNSGENDQRPKTEHANILSQLLHAYMYRHTESFLKHRRAEIQNMIFTSLFFEAYHLYLVLLYIYIHIYIYICRYTHIYIYI